MEKIIVAITATKTNAVRRSLTCLPQRHCFFFLDVNECADTATPPCSQICMDKPVGYACLCKPGYELKKGHLCIDVNECLDYPCSQVCENTVGSYKCSCVEGYELAADGKNCRATGPKVKFIVANR